MVDDAILIYASTLAADMRHVIPHDVHDPFLYIEVDGAPHVAIKSLEAARMRDVPGMTVFPLDELGFDDFRAAGQDPDLAELSTLVAACRRLGVTHAAVPPTFPLEVADHLRANGVEVRVDRDLFVQRRRVKTPHELAGIRRAQVAAEAGVSLVADAMHRATVDADGGLLLDGTPLTCEDLKDRIRSVFLRNGCEDAGMIVAHGAQTCIGHHAGSGQIFEGEPVTVDICPRDIASGGNSDMTRTFVTGDIDDELAFYYDIVKKSFDATLAAIRPGLPVAELHRISCEPIEAAGQPTQLTKKPGEVLDEGYFHSLGHGVGLEVHEPPSLNQNDAVLVAGDVIAIEPGCYRQGFGGVRLEDIVLVTEDGYELISDYPYDLVPVSLPRGK
ncbi:Xaa-Pro peptidase family protein [Microbacterium sp. BDGP8]|uniref:M24 family metallopeptidase n=1 Tax=Microbacterium sp. BDGP8 TaxID=3035531 RepID=UPI00249F6A33|nr:Xaa-Pro peptidase family protein [Microbacterium sp. BDGP8]WHE34850.1 Xaa-Pro peptidase family protein [Microbacterium sp. BDGP8]